MSIRIEDGRAQEVVDQFLALAEMPRASGHEAAIAAYLVGWAHGRGLEAVRDAAGNVRVEVPASAGREGEGAVILQAHMDMVAAPDPSAAPVPVLDGDGRTLRAEHSTLGADDGIGIAIILKVLGAPPESHPALRGLFTVEEETTMRGACGMSAEWLAGAQGLVNVDWERGGEACVGSAGCKTLTLSRTFESWTEATGAHGYTVALRNYPGGHSGMDIGKGIANPVLVLARALAGELAGLKPRLHALVGGSAHNAIPQNAIATFTSGDRATPLALTKLREALVAGAPAGASIPVGPLGAEAKASVFCLSEEDSALFARLLAACPAGVLKAGAGGAPEVSANVGIASLAHAVPNAAAQVVVSVRAHSEEDLAAICGRYRKLAEGFGFDCSAPEGAGPWNPARSAWVERLVAGGEGWPACRAVRAHAGLECSVFAEKAPGLPMVSVGPTVENPHSLAEALDTGTVADALAVVRRAAAGLD